MFWQFEGWGAQSCLRHNLNLKYIHWLQRCNIIGAQFMYKFGACKGPARRHQNPEAEPYPENVVLTLKRSHFGYILIILGVGYVKPDFWNQYINRLTFSKTVQRTLCTSRQVGWTYRAPSARPGLLPCTRGLPSARSGLLSWPQKNTRRL